jgi:hypothetical protein
MGCFGGPVGGALGGSLDGIKLPAFPASSAGIASIGGIEGAGKGGHTDPSKAGRLGRSLSGSLTGSPGPRPLWSASMFLSHSCRDSCLSAFPKQNRFVQLQFLGQVLACLQSNSIFQKAVFARVDNQNHSFSHLVPILGKPRPA